MHSAIQTVPSGPAFPVVDFRPAAARRRILDAARQLLRQHGYERFTMESVAIRSGLTRRTLYNQFEDRDALYRASRLELMESFEDLLPREIMPQADVRATMERFFTAALEILASSDHRELHMSVERDAASVPWLRDLYASRIERPLRLAIEHYLLSQKADGALDIAAPAPHACYCLTMIKAAVSAPDQSPVFDASELAAIFVRRLGQPIDNLAASPLSS